jgi:hypothetical protein
MFLMHNQYQSEKNGRRMRERIVGREREGGELTARWVQILTDPLIPSPRMAPLLTS